MSDLHRAGLTSWKIVLVALLVILFGILSVFSFPYKDRLSLPIGISSSFALNKDQTISLKDKALPSSEQHTAIAQWMPKSAAPQLSWGKKAYGRSSLAPLSARDKGHEVDSAFVPRLKSSASTDRKRRDPTVLSAVSDSERQSQHEKPEVQTDTYHNIISSQSSTETAFGQTRRSFRETQEEAVQRAQDKLHQTSVNGRYPMDPIPGIKTAYVVGFGKRHIQAAFETLLAAREAKEIFKGQPLPDIIAIHPNIGTCLLDIVKGVLPDIILLETNWTSYRDEYFLKLAVFSDPLFRQYSSVVWGDVDRRILSPSAFALIGSGQSLHRANATLHIAVRTQVARSNFLNRFFTKKQKAMYQERGYDQWVSVQSNAFELKPDRLIPPDQMTARIHELLTTFKRGVVNKNDQAFIPYMVGPDDISAICPGFPFETEHLNSYWMKDIPADPDNWNCNTSKYVEIRRHFSSIVDKALNMYLKQTKNSSGPCANDVRVVLDCHAKALASLDQCIADGFELREALIVHSVHSRCMQAFYSSPVKEFDAELKLVTLRTDLEIETGRNIPKDRTRSVKKP